MEGKVRVTSAVLNKNVILLPGDAVRVVNNSLEEWDFALTESNWTLGESTFKNTPINQVLMSLENQFDIKLDKSNIDSNKRFTGAFTHKDLKFSPKNRFSANGLILLC